LYRTETRQQAGISVQVKIAVTMDQIRTDIQIPNQYFLIRKQKVNIRFALIPYFLATDPEARVRFPALPEKKAMGLERGPLSLVSTIEELLDRKVASSV
jgi:hypothetical protein